MLLVRRIGTALVALAAAAVLVSCTGDPTPPRVMTPPETTSIAVPSAIPNDPALRAAVALRSCAAAPGGWRATGSVANTTASARDYRITILFTTTTATVIGQGSATVHVAAGDTTRWVVSPRFAAASPTLCVLSGVA